MARFNTSRTVPARFDSIGTVVDGTVLSITEEPVPEFVNGRIVGPKRNVGGDPIMQTDIVLDVSGARTLIHARGGIEFAIGRAIEDGKLGDLHTSDYLSLTYVEDEDMGEGLSPAKVYTAEIVRGGKPAAPANAETVATK